MAEARLEILHAYTVDVWGPTEKYAKVGHRGSVGAGSPNLVMNFETSSYLRNG